MFRERGSPGNHPPTYSRSCNNSHANCTHHPRQQWTSTQSATSFSNCRDAVSNNIRKSQAQSSVAVSEMMMASSPCNGCGDHQLPMTVPDDVCHRDFHLLIPSRYIIFPAISWPSLRSSSFCMYHKCLLCGAVGAILLTCDHHLILFLFAVCSAGCMFTRRLISSFRVLSFLVFRAAFLRHLISVVVNICLSLLLRVRFSL